DHNTPTDGTPVAARIRDELSRVQVQTLERNCAEFGIPVYSLGSDRQGIVHVIGPELGVTQTGMTIVCGDSHTATHGAFGALAFGVGTSEVEHVLATQCLVQHRPKTMRIRYEGERRARVYMELHAETQIQKIRMIRVFIGSCTNSRSGYLRAAAEVVQGRRVAAGVHAMVVPGSAQVKAQAEREGLDDVFRSAGF